MLKSSFEQFQDKLFDESISIQDQLPKKQDQASTLTPSKERKLQQNRISAHNSRLKKKKYLQDLQNNEKQLILQLEKTDQELQKTKQQLNSILTKNKQNDCFNHDQKPTYERLKQLVQDQHYFDEDEVNILIELLIDRVGVTGKQRRRMVQYYTKRMFNFSITALDRYFLLTPNTQKGLLDHLKYEGEKSWDIQLIKTLNLSPEQNDTIKQMQEKIVAEKPKWINLIQEFNSTRAEMYSLSSNVEKWLLKVKKRLEVGQVGQIIIGIERRKYNKNIIYSEESLRDKPQKKIKQQ